MSGDPGSDVNNAVVAAAVESKGGAGTKGGRKETLAELYKLNQVYYTIPPTLSLVTQRKYVRQPFQKTSYTSAGNDTMTCIFNTGEFYVAPKTSYLVIQCGFNSAALSFPGSTQIMSSSTGAFLSPNGNILQIVDECVLTSASGTEINREQNKGLQNAHVLRNVLPASYIQTQTMQGWAQGPPGVASGVIKKAAPRLPLPLINSYGLSDSSVIASTGVVNSLGAGLVDLYVPNGPGGATQTGTPSTYPLVNQGKTYRTFYVPISQLLGFFDPYMNTLIPAQAIAGARFDMRLKGLQEPIWVQDTITGSTPPATTAPSLQSNFIINNIYFELDCFQFNDSVLKRLNELSASGEGLSYLFDTWDWVQTSAPSSRVEAQVSQARSRITRSFAVVRDSAALTNPYQNSMASEPLLDRETPEVYAGMGSAQFSPGTDWYGATTVNSYQASLGSLFFPQQPITTFQEMFYNAQFVFGKGGMFNSLENNSITVDDFAGCYGVTWNGGTARVPGDAEYSSNVGCGTLGFLAERSQLLQLSGLTVSNARLLRHMISFTAGPTETDGMSGQPRRIDVFTQFTRILKVFLGGRCVVRE